MPRLPILSAVALAALGVLGALFVERVDDGFVISVGAYVVDPVGEAKLAYTRATRDCSSVQKADTQSLLSALASSDLDPKLKAAQPSPRAGWKQDGWLLVEADFENLEPALFLVKQRLNQFEVLATYSGTAAPFNDIQFIHQYLVTQRRDVPLPLVNCYEPVGAPFAGLS
jgi:hypothetical protein